MKFILKSLVLVVLIGFIVTGYASVIDGQNWADTLVSYSSGIQNYDGDLITTATEYYALGQSDADQNNNMYAWDWEAGDLDNVVGWRGGGNQEFVVGFNSALENVAGDDLAIRMYCGSIATATIFVSSDNLSWTEIGTIEGVKKQVPGSPGKLYDATFDFDGIFTGSASYVKVVRGTQGVSGTGMFFDSFASVPEPATMAILALGTLCFRKRK